MLTPLKPGHMLTKDDSQQIVALTPDSKRKRKHEPTPPPGSRSPTPAPSPKRPAPGPRDQSPPLSQRS
ncbi:hypothetical protein N7G274_008429 [Stereocaulon virgatum]|uniref:Uncharacterized protein n=1 Tax=Stereocaulon virgatum TaxID=373712 RepID=A0ABR4A110_9LECA